jgi:hypothetical protein
MEAKKKKKKKKKFFSKTTKAILKLLFRPGNTSDNLHEAVEKGYIQLRAQTFINLKHNLGRARCHLTF